MSWPGFESGRPLWLLTVRLVLPGCALGGPDLCVSISEPLWPRSGRRDVRDCLGHRGSASSSACPLPYRPTCTSFPSQRARGLSACATVRAARVRRFHTCRREATAEEARDERDARAEPERRIGLPLNAFDLRVPLRRVVWVGRVGGDLGAGPGNHDLRSNVDHLTPKPKGPSAGFSCGNRTRSTSSSEKDVSLRSVAPRLASQGRAVGGR